MYIRGKACMKMPYTIALFIIEKEWKQFHWVTGRMSYATVFLNVIGTNKCNHIKQQGQSVWINK